MKVKYRRIPYISPWAYTLVAVFCGLIHGGGLIHGVLIHGGLKCVRIFIRNGMISTFFLKLACISMIFVRHGLIHGGAYTRVLKLRSKSGRF